MKKVKAEHINRFRSGKKDMPSAVDDAADVMSKHTKKETRFVDLLLAVPMQILLFCQQVIVSQFHSSILSPGI